MKKIAALFFAAASVAVWTIPASADEPVARRRAAARPAAAPAPAPVQTTNWSGGQMGSSNGVSSVNNNFVEPGSYNCFAAPLFFASCFETPFSVADSRAGFITGVFLGYRWQMGMWVAGVEGDINYKFNGKTSNYQNTPPIFQSYEEFTGTANQTWDGSGRARLGYLVTPQVLFYVTGGVAFGKVEGSYSYKGCETFSAFGGCVYGAGSWSDTRIGYTVGGGVEAAISYGWKARVEYRYTDLGDYSVNIPLANNYGGACSSLCGTNARIDLGPTNQRITFGIGFDF